MFFSLFILIQNKGLILIYGFIYFYVVLFSDEQLVLYGNFSVLGLLVLKHHGRRPKSTDFSVYKFIQARTSYDMEGTINFDPDVNERSRGSP